jgi:hypothetical protein
MLDRKDAKSAQLNPVAARQPASRSAPRRAKNPLTYVLVSFTFRIPETSAYPPLPVLVTVGPDPSVGANWFSGAHEERTVTTALREVASSPGCLRSLS